MTLVSFRMILRPRDSFAAARGRFGALVYLRSLSRSGRDANGVDIVEAAVHFVFEIFHQAQQR
jgi:hypothetical protein